MALSLNCLVVDDKHDKIFTVKIPKSETVSLLKELIIRENLSFLAHVDVEKIDLWHVSFPIDNLEKDLENINLASYPKLSPHSKELTAFFTDVDDDCIHIIVKVDPTQLFSLNCFLLGDNPKPTFTVNIPKVKYVSHLKFLIKEKQAPYLDHVDAPSLQVWRVSFPIENFAKDVENIDLASYPKLLNHKSLTTFFTDGEADRLHVIVKPLIKAPVMQTASVLDSTELLWLNCFFLGDLPDRMFIVKIPKNKNVSILKDLIKEKNPRSLRNVAASNLDLWQVSFPADHLYFKDPPIAGPKLRSEKLLSDVFCSALDISSIHVVVHIPVKGVPSPSSGSPPHTFLVPSTDELSLDREKFCSQRKSEAPSIGGNPRTFLDMQDTTDGYINCNRPYGLPTALPLSLLHPIFGEYADDAENHVPTPDDAQFLLAFVQAMADIHTMEDSRRKQIRNVFDDHNIPIKRTMIGRFLTSGDLSFGEYRFLLANFKNEIGSQAAEPVFEATLQYLEATRNFATEHLNSVLPCIIVLIFGPYVAFAGAAWANRPVVQMLSPAIPCHYHDTDIKMEGMLVRHLGALRRAIHSLDAYYRVYSADPTPLLRNPTLPYPTTFPSQDGSVKRFKYLSQMEDRNLFFGSMDDGIRICIKFVTRYCEEGHKFLAAKGFAPKLHAVVRLPGGLYMVVMDDASQDYVSLFNLLQRNPDLLLEEHLHTRNFISEQIRQCLQQFHQAGFVHGDIRDANIMVKPLEWGDGPFLIVDYDSCGGIKQVRYPLYLNTVSVKRPEGAIGGAVIEVEHDLEMLEYIWAQVIQADQ
ncbi:hypothetical protein GALMADRAFT_144169 [Galerina marginata CBS 339.88]|uniref:Crinkler effector protein N-terminal domain-containing protein n=1 Tax=Galerina marginata (strain CBS 339.88) TaxID=685588 RepID=A0A067SWF2_GALM3|nr:hypothetical protein GALMADRAFT_144169 [Galerina marginata CBS 339.88]